MTINKEAVKKISKLSRIASNDEFETSMIKDLNTILKFVDQLNEVDTKDIEPLSSVVEQKLFQREDVVKKMNEKEEILKNSPNKNENYFVVPKVIE
ncbi:MAG: Asp-tRNA(Asn)/Glu-tRNA(Gln) amidotransferase subunit GatC [Pelagibacteraceae bacterium]|jgi:aspartyl-tRNA(Asn)/glutamyl-tRNA(Gln) amidotransferase subunit C|nr:Asp-tRNA(Asn)/Glu-tRNA(Gln) amidotransferase subunit GatC [Candidatus Pelagibacter sp.]MDA7741354.1 Asp-tRNA(Asn)/Glu-tRNA(Gln) amidotransferase subunit GatC [bacterium]MDA9168333.1 Asp-tRNA(Asn)/Glu-tRNA(Gln) amidotransferase subunit GatC [Pelagibacteraceae bacterium]MDB0036568.1 Asp-tRNA(Asn)/Glu-tRNA(Gln) amidotransferase subunit GatC [Pelagibacteraceae bacterium]MDC0425540.1 Asp-tRNA(Asn)/Glu-tRNA(Gln) amidotransferase subunit GatC [Pelagibacteraceae bacterium]|tara:strand:+ start:674 stop:961 length:288 start_codon:yes stop_codon:yes gene_type:complete